MHDHVINHRFWQQVSNHLTSNRAWDGLALLWLIYQQHWQHTNAAESKRRVLHIHLRCPPTTGYFSALIRQISTTSIESPDLKQSRGWVGAALAHLPAALATYKRSWIETESTAYSFEVPAAPPTTGYFSALIRQILTTSIEGYIFYSAAESWKIQIKKSIALHFSKKSIASSSSSVFYSSTCFPPLAFAICWIQ
jgi:hypothetical protein